ncbi:shikimate kinase [Clostridium caldaquaticum]|uniref:shikimate kinase n=1 Tax=Clostridium caldaquaticum TaxID=2940653 RepID=UPI0025727A44|nr:shikimate kinase [Clostridium caldaquaticum]
MNKNIVFIGMPGSGKTTMGKAVSERLGLTFYDVDEYIIKKEGCSIKDIFKHGEDHFRKIESEAIKELAENYPCVISTGGGAVKIPSNMEVLHKNSVIIFINRPVEKILGDIDASTRPLLSGDVSRIHNLFKERYPLYKKYCDIEVMNDKSFDEVVDNVIQCIEQQELVSISCK